jgi:ABC-type uncharacterized transport system involved in gliding motility auxiliary subunit
MSLRALDRRRLTGLAIVLAIVLFFALNLLAQNLLTSSRLDLTEDQLFTVSDGTKQVLAAIDEPVDLRFYYSAKLDDIGAYFATYGGRVRELLEEYERLSGGKVRIERLDPEPFSPEEDLAVAEGVHGVTVSNDGAQAYFGIAGRNSTDDSQVIAYLAPERADFLEYDLTRLVYDLANPEKPVVGVIGDLPLMGTQFNQGQPWLVLESMFEAFDVRFLGGAQKRIEDDVDVLMLAQPARLDPASLYAIDQFVMRGGRVLAFVDPLAEVMAAPNPMAPQPEGDAIGTLDPLLKAWGVEIPKGRVIGDAQMAQRVGARINGRDAVVQYLPWLAVDPAHLDQNLAITAELQRITLNSAGSIRARDGATTKIEPLVSSSADAMEIDAEPLKFAPDPARLINEFVPGGKPFTLAARVTGPIKSAYADGPPEGADETLVKSHKAEAEAPLNLVLVADADLLADRNWVRQQDMLGQRIALPVANNGDFAVNVLDYLSGSEGLIGLRGRGLSIRPFEVVEAMARDAETKYRTKEQELLVKIEEVQTKIRDLQQDEQQTGVLLTAEQQTEIENFRGEMIGFRQQLREVQRSLRQDVEGLTSWLKFLNIWAVPLVIGLVAVLLAAIRRMRAARYAARPSAG